MYECALGTNSYPKSRLFYDVPKNNCEDDVAVSQNNFSFYFTDGFGPLKSVSL
jgi:hypothetical protein